MIYQKKFSSVLLYSIPIIVSAIGVGIHLLGVLLLFQLEVPRLVHGVMLIIDTLVVLGLLRKIIPGYWLAVLLYIQQAIMQPYWAMLNYLHHKSLFQLLVASPLVITCLIILVFNRKLFIKKY